MLKLTHELIEAGATKLKGKPCGWSRKQLAILGVPWPLVKGWKSKLVGVEIPEAWYEEFLSLRGKRKARRDRALDL